MSMVDERTCDYTGESIEPGTGIMYVAADGSVLHFVDSKAEKNYFMGREARDLPWTEAGRAQAEARKPDTSTEEPEETEPSDVDRGEPVRTPDESAAGPTEEKVEETATEEAPEPDVSDSPDEVSEDEADKTPEASDKGEPETSEDEADETSDDEDDATAEEASS